MKEIDAAKVELLASQGLTVDQVADCLGVGRTTLYNRMKRKRDVRDALKRGRSKGIATVTNALFQAARHGNVTAMIFYLKNRAPAEWRDRRDLELSGQGGEPVDLNWTVHIVDPQAVPKICKADNAH